MMTEWQVVGVIVVLLGLTATVIKPIVTLNSSITRLTELCSFLEKNIEDLTRKNGEAHDRLWHRTDEHDAKLQVHETRIALLESAEK